MQSNISFAKIYQMGKDRLNDQEEFYRLLQKFENRPADLQSELERRAQERSMSVPPDDRSKFIRSQIHKFGDRALEAQESGLNDLATYFTAQVGAYTAVAGEVSSGPENVRAENVLDGLRRLAALPLSLKRAIIKPRNRN